METNIESAERIGKELGLEQYRIDALAKFFDDCDKIGISHEEGLNIAYLKALDQQYEQETGIKLH